MIRQLHLRRLWEHPVRTLVAVVAIAGGVALSSGVLIGRASIQRALDGYTESLGGFADLQVTGPVDQAGLPDDVVGDLRAVPGVGAVAPTVVATTVAEQPDGDEEYVTVLGVDCDVVPLCAPGGLAASTELLDDLGPGAVVRTNTGTLSLDAAAATPALDGLAGGSFLVVPLDDAQRVFDRGAWFDTAFVVLEPGADAAGVRAALGAAAGAQAVVREPDASRLGEDVVGQLMIGLLLTSLVGLAIGGQLVSNTLTLSFEERRREFAAVAALGATPRRLGRGVLSEAAVLGGVGGLVGAPFGVLIAAPAIASLNDQYGRATGVLIEVVVPPAVVAGTVLLGIGVGLVGAVRAVRRVARLDLAAELVERDRHDPQAPWARGRAAVAAVGLAVSVVIGWLGSRDGSIERWQPVAVVVGLFLGATCAVRLPGYVAQPFVDLLARRSRASGAVRTALGALAGDPRRSVVITGAIASAVAVGVTIGGIEPALREGAEDMAARATGDGVYVSALPVNNGVGLDAKLSDEEEAVVAAVPGVATVTHRRNATIDHPDVGLLQLVGEGTPPTAFDVVRGGDPTVGLAAGEAFLGPAFARGEDLSVGDTFTLPGREGPVQLVVGGIWEAPAGLGRSVSVGAEAFAEIAGPRRATYLVARPEEGVSSAELEARLREAGVRPGVTVAAAGRYGELLGEEFTSFTTPFVAIQRGLVVVAIVATTSTLLLAGIQRRREHAMMSALGMTPSALAGSTVIEVVVLGVLGTVLGGLAGVAAAVCYQWASGVMTGLRIDVVWTLGPVLSIGLVTTAGAIVGALLPAWRTARIDPAVALRYE